jgi:hypothetical protein
MDVISTEPSLTYLDVAPVLIAGSTESELARAKTTVSAFGLRIGDAVRVADAAVRLDKQARASAV